MGNKECCVYSVHAGDSECVIWSSVVKNRTIAELKSRSNFTSPSTSHTYSILYTVHCIQAEGQEIDETDSICNITK